MFRQPVVTQSVFFPFDFTPANSTLAFNANAPGQIAFASNATFPDTVAQNPESLVLEVTPASPLSNAGGTINISLSNSAECFDCNRYRLFASGTISSTQPSQTGLAVTPAALDFQAWPGAPAIAIASDRRYDGHSLAGNGSNVVGLRLAECVAGSGADSRIAYGSGQFRQFGGWDLPREHYGPSARSHDFYHGHIGSNIIIRAIRQL